jgi:hypothetical protein
VLLEELAPVELLDALHQQGGWRFVAAHAGMLPHNPRPDQCL